MKLTSVRQAFEKNLLSILSIQNTTLSKTDIFLDHPVKYLYVMSLLKNFFFI